MPDLLFEIGTEELPPKSIQSLEQQLVNKITQELKSKGIIFSESKINTFTTPRRIAININDLPKAQEKKVIEVKGPSKDKAFDSNGKPTEAAIGFAKKQNIDPKDLKLKSVDGAEYVFATVNTGGKDIQSILKDAITQGIKSCTGEKFMIWGDYKITFSRPIRWLLLLVDNEVVDFDYEGIKSSNKSHGHRFFTKDPFEIKSPKDYEKDLEANKIIAKHDKRKTLIIELLNKKAKELKLSINIDEELLQEVTNITEFPSCIDCSFNKDFLTLPDFIIETVLKKHQKYFVLRDSDKGLSNHFLVITNGVETFNKSNSKTIEINVKEGNEKVVAARLNDAKFFTDEDLKIPFKIDHRKEMLSKVTFQKGLGTMLSKLERIEKISSFIYSYLESQKTKSLECHTNQVSEAARLCKLDLTTQIVFEMPELQGKIGAFYAMKNGYTEIVCKGISEHYTQTCSKNLIAQIIGLADKIDNLIALFSIGKIPTSSADPFGLRGQVNWIYTSISDLYKEHNIKFELRKLLDFYKSNIDIESFKDIDKNELFNKVSEFINERFKLLISAEFNTSSDILNSVFNVSKPFDEIINTKNRISIVNKNFTTPDDNSKSFLIAAKRLVRIVDKDVHGELKIENLKDENEIKLLKSFETIEKKAIAEDFEYLELLKTLTTDINIFFDKVLVNDKDPEVKKNRHMLLNKGKKLFERICDFNEIIEK